MTTTHKDDESSCLALACRELQFDGADLWVKSMAPSRRPRSGGDEGSCDKFRRVRRYRPSSHRSSGGQQPQGGVGVVDEKGMVDPNGLSRLVSPLA